MAGYAVPAVVKTGQAAGFNPTVVKTGQAAPVGSMGQQRAAAAGYSISPTTGGYAPWAPPPIPIGDYNPSRDIEEAEGKLATEQGISGDERTRSVDENTYATNLQLLGEKEASQKQTSKETLARLARGYQQLGAKQGEQANASGTLYGGALIAAAAKRAANEGLTKGTDERSIAESLKGDENERGKLSVAEGQLLGPGGSLVEAIQNARQSEQQREEDIGKAKSEEASKEHGYEAPKGPVAKVVARPPVVTKKAK